MPHAISARLLKLLRLIAAAALLAFVVAACNPADEGEANGATDTPAAEETSPDLGAEPTQPEGAEAEAPATDVGTTDAGDAAATEDAPDTAQADEATDAAADGEAADATAEGDAAEGEAAEGEAATATAAQEGDEARAQGQADQAMGESAYANCAACHQQNGEGVPGAFPPLAGHMPTLAQAEGGREYLINVVLFGLQGQITVDGQTYNGVMPAWQQLSDEQVAAVLNYELTSWGNAEALGDFEPITPEEVAAQRAQGLTMQDVYAQRQELGLE